MAKLTIDLLVYTTEQFLQSGSSIKKTQRLFKSLFCSKDRYIFKKFLKNNFYFQQDVALYREDLLWRHFV